MNGKQQLIVGLMLVVGLAACCFGEEEQQEPKDVKELTSLRTQYEQAIKQVTRPIQERYRAQLEALVKQLGAAGKIEDAAQVQKALQDVALDLATDAAPAKTSKTANKLKIISAKYGADTRWVDATTYVAAKCGTTNVLVWNNAELDSTCGDPTGGPGKTVVIVYKYNGKQKQKIMAGKNIMLD